MLTGSNASTNTESAVSDAVICRTSLLAAVARRDLTGAVEICDRLLQLDENDSSLAEFKESLNGLIEKAKDREASQSESDQDSSSGSSSSCRFDADTN